MGLASYLGQPIFRISGLSQAGSKLGNLAHTKSESYNPDSKQAACVGANGVFPAQPGLAKADLVLGVLVATRFLLSHGHADGVLVKVDDRLAEVFDKQCRHISGEPLSHQHPLHGHITDVVR